MKGKEGVERYSRVSRRMWNDERFRRLSAPETPNAQHLWFRLLTGPELGIVPGCFQAWDGGLARALRWPVDGTVKAFQEIVDQGLGIADWEVGFVFVYKAIKHNLPTSPNVVKSWKKPWNELPECELKHEAFQSLKAFVEGMGKAYSKAFNETFPKASGNQEQEQEQDQEQEQEGDPHTPSKADLTKQAKGVFEYWQKVHDHPTTTFDEKRRMRIVKALQLGKNAAELCRAIRGAKQDAWLMGTDPKSTRAYDGLETLLRDITQIERLIELDDEAQIKKAAAGAPARPAGPRRPDADEEALAARKRAQNQAALDGATPEERAKAEVQAGAVAKLAQGLMR